MTRLPPDRPIDACWTNHGVVRAPLPDWAGVVLRCAEMGQADAWAMAHGQPGPLLMERAGAGVVQALVARWSPCPVWVLCGPGNNGGDGWVVARLLEAAGWAEVHVACDTPLAELKGDAAHHATRWASAREQLGRPAEFGSLASAVADMGARLGASRVAPQAPGASGALSVLVVDALFGAGLVRPLAESALAALQQVAAWRAASGVDGSPGEPRVQVLAIDVPSGLSGDTGEPLGGQALACSADLTVTFMAPKPAHVLMNSLRHMGDVVVHDIGLPLAALHAVAAQALDEGRGLIQRNTPTAWQGHWRPPRRDGHKYHRGHVLVWSGSRMPGAARLSARAAARIGAGLLTMAVGEAAWPHLAGHLVSAMAHPLSDHCAEALLADWQALLDSRRWGALVLGPGALPGLPAMASTHPLADRAHEPASAHHTLQALVLRALATEWPLVLDADALMAFEAPGQADTLFAAVQGRARRWGDSRVVLTPHEGEFDRLFGGPAANPEADPQADTPNDKFTRTLQAAQRAGCVVLHKGADTVLCGPDGRLMLHDDAPPWLATAGAGDVLAGFIAGLMAQGLPSWEAAAAAAWVHGQCAHRFGPGLLADDLPEQVPAVLRRLWGVPQR